MKGTDEWLLVTHTVPNHCATLEIIVLINFQSQYYLVSCMY